MLTGDGMVFLMVIMNMAFLVKTPAFVSRMEWILET